MQQLSSRLARYAPHALIVAIVGYILCFSLLSSIKLAALRQGFDMAGNEQVIWNTLHGRFFQTSVFALMEHDFDDGPVLLQLPLALLYGIYQSPYTLMVLQSAALGLAALPLYLLCRDLLGGPWPGLAFALIYLIHPTTQHINMYEFQLRSFMIPFALAALLFLRRAKLWPYLLFLFLMLCTKTEAGFTLMAFGGYALLLRRPWPFVLVPLLVGPAWVAVALGVIVPRFSSGDFITSIYSYGELGDSVGAVIINVLTNPLLLLKAISLPAKLAYVGQLLGLQGFLALLSPISILALPVLGINLIAPETNRVQFSLYYQYGALVFPFLVVGAADGLQRLAGWVSRSEQRRAQLIGIGCALLLVGAVYANLTLGNVVKNLVGNREPTGRVADAQAVIAQVPNDAALAASTFLAPHLAQREQLYFFPGNNSYPAKKIALADYLIADTRPGGERPSADQQEERAALQEYMTSPEWELVAQSGDFVLLRRRPEL